MIAEKAARLEGADIEIEWVNAVDDRDDGESDDQQKAESKAEANGEEES
jgi:hypothetical protein